MAVRTDIPKDRGKSRFFGELEQQSVKIYRGREELPIDRLGFSSQEWDHSGERSESILSLEMTEAELRHLGSVVYRDYKSLVDKKDPVLAEEWFSEVTVPQSAELFCEDAASLYGYLNDPY